LKLLIFIHSLSSGGAERVTANLANHWADKGWHIAVVTLALQSNDFYELHPAVKRIALELAGDSGNVLAGLWQNLRRVFALRRVLRQFKPTIALGMTTTANILLALATWGLPQVHAIGSERIHPPQWPLGAIWEGLRRHTYGRLAAVTALTSESADWLKVHTGARRVPVIPNAALWPLPMQAPRVTPDSLCQSGRQLLLAVGRLDAQKGFDWLEDAFINLAERYPDWDLVILGEGPQRATLQDHARAAGLKKRVFLPGRVGNVGEWYERADLYVMSSRFEGFPNVLAEAMAHGLAAVSFDCDTGPRDVIRHEVDGLLVPPGDVAGLTAALDRLMGDIGLRRQFAERAVEVRRRFSIERIAGMWEDLFKESMK
jgi:glycosyltransferase involved in cell wall biosynthesis